MYYVGAIFLFFGDSKYFIEERGWLWKIIEVLQEDGGQPMNFELGHIATSAPRRKTLTLDDIVD